MSHEQINELEYVLKNVEDPDRQEEMKHVLRQNRMRIAEMDEHKKELGQTLA
jgi:hypothetical protein